MTMPMQRKFRKILGIAQTQSAYIRVQPELLTAVSQIAAQDGRSVTEIINALLSSALYEYQLASHSLQTWRQLTPREKEITALIWLGLSNPQISQRLSISPNTVKAHVRSILAKYQVNSKEALREQLQGIDLSDWTQPKDNTSSTP